MKALKFFLSTVVFTGSFCLVQAQSYKKVEKSLTSFNKEKGYTFETLKSDEEKIKNYMSANSTKVDPEAFYDLGMVYYKEVLIAPDKKAEIYPKIEENFTKYIAVCNPKFKWFAYWDLAVCSANFNNCNKSMEYLSLAKENYKGAASKWDKTEEDAIRSMCTKR